MHNLQRNVYYKDILQYKSLKYFYVIHFTIERDEIRNFISQYYVFRF